MVFFLANYLFGNSPRTWTNRAAKVPPHPMGANLKLVSLVVGSMYGSEAINVTLIYGGI